MRRRQTRGFTLVEILFVVTIIAMLAILAGVVSLRARMVTFEQLAVTTLHAYTKTLGFYFGVNMQYPPDLTALGAPIANPPYLEPDLIGDGTTVQRQGYVFVYARPAASRYTVTANPQQDEKTGNRHFFSDESGIIRFTYEHRDATASDAVIQ